MCPAAKRAEHAIAANPARSDRAIAEEIGVTFGGSSAARMMPLVLGTCVLSCTSRSKISSPPGPHE
jgi:hypothetical protein